MGLLSLAEIMGRAALVRHKAGYTNSEPPYSTHVIIESAFPGVQVGGADLKPHILEMAQTDGRRRALWYNRNVPHPAQRTGLAHGLHHFLTDLRDADGMRECNVKERRQQRILDEKAPNEIASDMFGGELLAPFHVLDRHAPDVLFPKQPGFKEAWADELDRLASLFNVPPGYIAWRLYDLALLRKSHFFI